MGVTCSVIVPVYNEAEVLEQSYGRLRTVMEGIGGSYELIFVNDGSADGSTGILRGICAADPHCRAIFFSRNFGHQTAVTAGIDAACGDAVVIIDADLQDPPELIPVMLEQWRAGKKVVYGKRIERKGETAFKKLTASVFYRVLASLSETEIPTDAGDFRLIDREICELLRNMPEHNRYLRGMIAWVGFEQAAVEYVRDERAAGVTKYTLKKMLRLAEDGLVSFSSKPLRFALGSGVVVCAVSAAAALLTLILNLAGVTEVSGLYFLGWALMFVVGLTQIFLGIVGMYISRICDEVRGRPRYIASERIGFGEAGKDGEE